MELRESPKPYEASSEAGNFSLSIKKDLVPYTGNNIAVIGCGNGFETHYLIEELTEKKSGIKIIAYDSNKSIIENNKLFFDSLPEHNFTSDFNEIKNSHPDTVVSFFAIHHDPSIFNNTSDLLTAKKKLLVVDYDLNDISLDDFQRVFNSPSEINELKKIGLDQAYKIHTQFNYLDYTNMANKSGFNLITNGIFANNQKFRFYIFEKR